MAETKQGLPETAEAVIQRIRGVQAVHVESDDAGALRLVHILGAADRSARVIVSDVVAALAAELGVDVDPRLVRVAFEPAPGEGALTSPGRLKFVGLSVSTTSHLAEVMVHLEHAGLMYEGVAKGGYVNRLEPVAEATLRAVEVFLRVEQMFTLEGVRLLQVGSREAAVVVVTLLGRDNDVYTGSCPIREDRREAVVRAVLDSLNRLVSGLSGF